MAQYYFKEERCVVCGATIPEGRQVCPSCKSGNSDDEHSRWSTPIQIDNHSWLLDLPSGDFSKTEPLSDWDTAVASLGILKRHRLHWSEMFTICSVKSGAVKAHILRGGLSPKHHSSTLLSTSFFCKFTGYRPRISPANSRAALLNNKPLRDIPNGTTFTFASLYIDGKPVNIPEDPTPYGNILDFPPGKHISIGDSDQDPAKQITWIKVNDSLIADRCLFKNVSLRSLFSAGLIE